MATDAELSADSKTGVFSFTASERALMKSYLSYASFDGDGPTKIKSNACSYVANVLWPKTKPNHGDENDQNFFLEDSADSTHAKLSKFVEYLDGKKKDDVPSLFKVNKEQFKQMREEAKTFSDTQEIAILRTFAVRKKKKGKRCGTQGWIRRI